MDGRKKRGRKKRGEGEKSVDKGRISFCSRKEKRKEKGEEGLSRTKPSLCLFFLVRSSLHSLAILLPYEEEDPLNKIDMFPSANI